nr:immunoglobulin heavy chain junction region [Mus musculus]
CARNYGSSYFDFW